MISFFLSWASIPWAWADVGYYRQPSSDGTNVVFVAEDDLWIVPIEGGVAQRLTNMEGVELYPLLSPNGNKLFWTGQADGNREIYAAKLSCCGFEKSKPLEKWERLTWRQGTDRLLSFGETEEELIIQNSFQAPFFRSDIEILELETFSIRRFAENMHRVAKQGDGLLWQDQGTDWQIWKGYKGGLAPEIWMQNGEKKWNISNWEGEDTKPFWIDHDPYFLSDREGRMGLYTWKEGVVEQVFLSEDWDLHSPKTMPNGKIIAELAGQIIEIDPSVKESRIIPIELPEKKQKELSFLLEEYINQVSLSDSGEVLIQYRGQVEQVSENGEWKTLGFAEYIDETGEIWIQNGQLYLKERIKEGPFIQHSAGFDLIGSPSLGKEWIAVRSQDLGLWLFSVEDDQEPILLHQNIRFPIEDFSWSEDLKQLVFTGINEKGVQGIYLYDTQTKEKTLLSQDFSHQHDPVWLGEEIVFLSSSEISLHTGKDNQQQIISLEDRVVKYTHEGKLERLSIPIGSYQKLKIWNEQFLLLTQERELLRYDPRDRSWQSLQRDVENFQTGKDGRILIWKKKHIFWIDLNGKLSRELSLAGQVRQVEQTDEWSRIFEETLRLIKSSFVDETRLPSDWNERAASYQKLLPKLRSRTELNELLKELLGELGTSHLMVFGGTENPSGARIASIGADLQWQDKAWVITKVYDSGIEIPFRLPQSVEGMCIREISGEKPKKGIPIGRYLTEKVGKKMIIRVQDCEKEEDIQELIVQGLGSDRKVRELDWMFQNREAVHKQTNGEIGYIHLSNLQGEGLSSLERWIDVEYRKKGMIVDLRYNGGGYYEAAALERLFRAEIGQFQWANGKKESFPFHSASEQRLVFLVNGGTQSAGEGLALGAKELGATLIGTRTWGGYSSFGQKILPDGGVVGVTTVIWNGEDIENRGVQPNILIVEEGEQLEKAIEILLKKHQ